MSREMKNSGIPWIGEIPKDWKVVRTKNIFSQGKELVGENSAHTQLLSLTTRGIKQVEIGSTSGKIPDTYDTYQLVKKDNLVMCLFDLDCSAVFSGLSPYNGMISPAYKVLTLFSGYSPRFYDYWYAYIFDGRKYMFLSKNIRYSLTYDEFAALGIVAPPLSEQEAIAEYLDRKCGEIDELISLQEKMIEELKAYKQSIITETVTKGLNPNVSMKNSGIEWIGEIPAHWKSVPFKSVFLLGKGLNITKADLVGKGIPVISYGQIHSKLNKGTSINDALIRYVPESYLGNYPNSLVKKGDIIFADTSEDLEGCGNCLYIDRDMVLFAGYHTIIAYNQYNHKNKYFSYLFQTNCWRTQIRTVVNGVKLYSVPQKILSSTTILLPKHEEQKIIADYLDERCSEIDCLITLKQKKIEVLKDYKKSVIFEYVTGKKEVNG